MFFDDLEQRRAEIERHRENAARLAEVTARFHTAGQGSVEFANRVDFGLTFVHKPMIEYGAEMDLDDLDNRLNNDYNQNGCPPLPLTSGFVSDWDTDKNGYYVGAWCAARVHFPVEDLVPANFTVDVIHHFRFSAVAMKNVPMDLTD